MILDALEILFWETFLLILRQYETSHPSSSETNLIGMLRPLRQSVANSDRCLAWVAQAHDLSVEICIFQAVTVFSMASSPVLRSWMLFAKNAQLSAYAKTTAESDPTDTWMKSDTQTISASMAIIDMAPPSGTPVDDCKGSPTTPAMSKTRRSCLNMDSSAVTNWHGTPNLRIACRTGLRGIILKHFSRSTVTPILGLLVWSAHSISQSKEADKRSELTPEAVPAIWGGSKLLTCWMIWADRYFAQFRYILEAMVMGLVCKGSTGWSWVFASITTLANMSDLGHWNLPSSIAERKASSHWSNGSGMRTNSRAV